MTQHDDIKGLTTGLHTLIAAAELCLDCKSLSRGSEVHAAALNLLSDAHMSLLAIQDAIGNPHLYEPEPTLTAA